VLEFSATFNCPPVGCQTGVDAAATTINNLSVLYTAICRFGGWQLDARDRAGYQRTWHHQQKR